MGFGISNTWPNWNMGYTPTFGGFNNTFDFSNVWSTPTSTTSSTTSTENETYEEYKKRMEKEAKESEKSSANAELNVLKEDKLKELKIPETIEKVKAEKAQLEKSKKSDGTASSRTPYKKQGFWGKAGRWLSNAGSAAVNIGKNLVGIEKDGSWNWKKCLKNVAITAAAVGACFIPVVGPAIGYGLAAGGVVMGGIGVAKGVSNLNKASSNDDEAIDNAQQEVMTGAITAITSAFCLKGIGKAASNASMATERTGVAGKAWQSVSQFCRDITVNALKATGEAMKADKALIAAQDGGKITSFFKAWVSKMSGSAKGATEFENAYKDKYNEVKHDIETRLNEINNKLGIEKNAAKRALLQEEKAMYEFNLNEVNSLGTTIKSKADFEKLLKDNSGKFNKEYAAEMETTVNGTSVAPKRLKIFNKHVKKVQDAYTKKLKELIRAKNREMYCKAEGKNLPHYKNELREYVPTRDIESSWLKPSTWKKNEYQLAVGKTKQNSYGSLIKYATTHPATTVPKTIQIFDPVYSTPIGYGDDYTKEQSEEMIKNYDNQIALLEEAEKKFDNCKSVDELNALTKALQEQTTQPSEQHILTDDKQELKQVA